MNWSPSPTCISEIIFIKLLKNSVGITAIMTSLVFGLQGNLFVYSILFYHCVNFHIIFCFLSDYTQHESFFRLYLKRFVPCIYIIFIPLNQIRLDTLEIQVIIERIKQSPERFSYNLLGRKAYNRAYCPLTLSTIMHKQTITC